MAITCLDTLVGVSTQTCTCVDSNAALSYDPAAADENLWLDQLIDLKLLNESRCGDPDDLWTRAKNALNQADEFIQSEMNMAFTKRYTQRKLFSGSIGGKLQEATTPPTTTLKGLMLSNYQVRGAYLTINSIDIKTTATETINLTINDRLGNTYYSAATAVTANTYTNIPINAKVPLWWDEAKGEEQRYFIYHDSANTFSNSYSCGCGTDAWGEFFKVQGIHGNTAGDSEAWTKNGLAHGMVVNAKIDCPLEETICDMQGEQLTSLAHAKWYRAAIILGEYFLTSTEINRYTLYKSEELADKMMMWEHKYAEHLTYLSRAVVPGDCFRCNPGITKGSILA